MLYVCGCKHNTDKTETWRTQSAQLQDPRKDTTATILALLLCTKFQVQMICAAVGFPDDNEISGTSLVHLVQVVRELPDDSLVESLFQHCKKFVACLFIIKHTFEPHL
jgi:hypothetical protein